MNAKNLFRIALLVVSLCMILTVFAMADSKIIRFDGKDGSILGDAKNDVSAKGTTTISNGLARIDIPFANLTKADGTAIEAPQRTNFEVPVADHQFNLYDYPYIQFKYRTNYPKTLQFYLSADGGGYLYHQKSVAATEGWKTVSLYAPPHGTAGITATTVNPTEKELAEHPDTATSYIRYSYSYKNNALTTSGHSATNTTRPTFPSETKPAPVETFFIMLRGMDADTITSLNGADLYAEVEYIAFFSSESEMIAYSYKSNDPYKLMTFNDDSTVAFTPTSSIKDKDNAESVSVADGLYHLNMTKTGSANKTYQPTFTLAQDEHFLLYDYPYVKFKFKTNWSAEFQFYISHYPLTPDADGSTRTGYHVVNVHNPNEVGNGSFYSRADTEITGEFLYLYDHTVPETASGAIMKASKTHKSYTGYDGITWLARTSSAPSLSYMKDSSDYNYSPVKDIFLQLKSNANPTKNYYADLYYIAFFPDEASMKAFGADETKAVEDAKAAVEALELDYVVESADDIEDMIVADIKAVCEDVDVEVTIDGENVTVHISSFYANRDYTVNKTYTVTEIIPAADFGVAALGAQIRADGIFGLRFGFTIDTAQVPEGCTVTEFGTVIGLAGTTPVIGGENVAKVQAKNIFKTEGTVKTFTAVVTNIPDGTGEGEIDQRDTQLVARPYVTYTLGTKTYTTYGESVTKSVNEVVANAWGK
ncbi:MAG: hypothetical protein E7588_09020 [Ruminococcaceae bacterium]|nr:hypothetical protein [Oscillospiraceae bacterium]